ncbi:MAG TPA: FAD-binding oxidoreductase [Vicinamibacterales bacterium]|jgi:glycolate oxidase FAD binding subunit|nr:FAD-binding oxidoreductase [Vicinamibacterales bacterium]
MTVVDHARQGTPGEAVDGVTPRFVAEPTSGAAFAAALAAAAGGRLSTVIRGGGTKSGWGRPVDAVDLVLSTKSLADLLVHRDGDLTATVGAGVTLARLNTTLSARGQWLPVDSAFLGTTIGGLLATNDSGPLRQRFGTPRDLLIGITLALTDGRVVKAGGTVVKNVAGYDLGKLVTGSHGTLAAIVDATFKLLPLPHASATLRAVYTDPEPLAADAAAIAAGQLEPLAFDVRVADTPDGPRWTLFVRFASSPVAVSTQLEAARALVHGEPTALREGLETRAWSEQVGLAWESDPSTALGAGAVVRCSWLPSRLGELLGLLRALRAECGVTFTGRVGAGSGLLRLTGSDAAVGAAVERLRLDTSPVGHVVLLRASRPLRAQVDVWGAAPSAPAAALKRALDPASILNAGRGPL